ncbi:MAG: hypothetical protein WEA09_00215 [Gemmatimonadota bacterium]
MTAPAPADGGTSEVRRATLSKDLSEFLIELSIGVHRYAMYPRSHPSLRPVTQDILTGLGSLLSSRANLSIGVAQKQLIIEGVATDAKHPVLSDLARRLHSHQLGAISFTKGVTVVDLEGLLETLAVEPEREGSPVGLLPPDQLPAWDHVRIFPVGYDQLGMKESGESKEREPARATQLWLGLAQAAMASEDPLDPDAPPDATTVARTIEGHQRESAYDQVIVGYLLQLAEELKESEGAEADAVRARMSELVKELDGRTLQRMVEMGGNFAQRRRFVLDANQALAVESVVKILEAAANASQQTISSSLTRLLGKLANHSDQGPQRVRTQAIEAFRENVEELIENWELKDPNPDEYTLILDAMSRASPILAGANQEAELDGAARVLKTGLEVDVYGPTMQKAVSDLLDDGEVAQVLQLVDQASADNKLAERLRKQLTTPYQLRKLLAADDVDEDNLRDLVRRLGDTAVETLLETLVESESRAIRRKVFDCLAELGITVAERAVELAADSRWYVQRNMLALLQRVEELPKTFSPMPFLGHRDARVRREAFPLALRMPEKRDRGLGLALGDSDERLVRMALLELQTGVSESLLPTVVNRLLRDETHPDLRPLAIRAMKSSRSSLALKALLGVCDGGKSLLGRRKLASASPELHAALGVLRHQWREHPDAAWVFQAAEASKDADIRNWMTEGDNISS